MTQIIKSFDVPCRWIVEPDDVVPLMYALQPAFRMWIVLGILKDTYETVLLIVAISTLSLKCKAI